MLGPARTQQHTRAPALLVVPHVWVRRLDSNTALAGSTHGAGPTDLSRLSGRVGVALLAHSGAGCLPVLGSIVRD